MSPGGWDPDGEALTYQVAEAYWPSGASYTPATNLFSWPNPGPVCKQDTMVFRALDGSGGVHTRIVKYTTVIDSVDDLSPDLVGPDSLSLTWLAPGDDGLFGRGQEYELRYALFPLTEQTFLLGTRVTGMFKPQRAGRTEWQMIGSLQPATTYYVALRTRDTLNHWSVLSNLVEVTTMCDPCDGGPLAATRAPAGLMGSHAAEPLIDRPGGGRDTSGVLSVAMFPTGAGPTWSIRRLGPEELAALGAVDSLSVLLQSRDETGAWSTRGRIPQGGASSRYAVCAPRQPTRILFAGAYALQRVFEAVALDGGRGTASLTQALHSRRGDVTARLDSSGTEVAGSDTLSLSYQWAAATSAAVPDWFLVVGVAGSEGSTPARALPGAGDKPLPVAFALRQNQPNPFSGRTTIRFELPVASPVRLEVFDPQGRLVRRLADGPFPAGFHAVDWNQRATGGPAVAAGVYLYRLQAGAFRDQKKMVLLPR
jgi:hypothetical protein